MKYLVMGFIGIILIVALFSKQHSAEQKQMAAYMAQQQQAMQQARQAAEAQQRQLEAQVRAMEQADSEGGSDLAATDDATTSRPNATNLIDSKPRVDWGQRCHDTSLLGERMMYRHQAGGTLAELNTIANTADADLRSIVQELVTEASKTPRYDKPELQRDSVNVFKDKVYRTCMDKHP